MLASILRNVRLTNKISETYQDGTGVRLVVDKEREVFRIHMCTYHKKKKFYVPPCHNGQQEGRGMEEVVEGEPVGGVMWLLSWLVGWLACTGGLVGPGGDGPICVEADTLPGFC